MDLATPAPASTPAASPEASPVATPQAVVPVDAETAAALTETARVLAACLSSGDAVAVANLVTEQYLGTVYGGGERLSRTNYLIVAATAPVIPVEIRSVTDIAFGRPSTATAVVESIVGNQLRREEWTFLYRPDPEAASGTPGVIGDGTVIEGGGTPDAPTSPAGTGRWLVHDVSPLPVTPPEGAATVNATLDEYTVRLGNQIVSGPDVVIQGDNQGTESHELLVLRLQPGITTDALLQPAEDGAFPPGIEVIGQITLPAGDSGEMVLVGLETGQYAIVCLLPDPSGVPHLALGQETTMTVR